ncbi:MAG: metallophosphoesterase family protein [Bacteroidaceae bacterium]|nr:metallophosphoesterase family protein [Bacteroidaceae bacterium]MBR3633109.1 metallophosphoesterase family protein [Bacteroidaceae bacterium]
MKRILLISDTHNYWDPRYADYIAPCDEVWHAGDMCSYEHAQRFAELKPLRAVCGNCDGGDLRLVYPEVLRWRCEDVEVLMKHIGGYPGHYDPSARRYIQDLCRGEGEAHDERPQASRLFISGHSHILKVKYDERLGLLHINPGAAGLQGWQAVRTLVRFTIDGSDIKDLEVIELGK